MAEGTFYGIDSNRSELLKEFGFKEEESTEILERQWGKTGFPKPIKAYKLSWEVFDLSLEEPYFWVLEDLQQKFPIIDKIEDSFAAAENSAFFGVTQLRLGGQQDKVSQFLATIGKMIKELFQMVRELRIIDERLDYYKSVEEEVKKPITQRRKGHEITLKGYFVDLVQGGGKSAASVYGMARELEFITLPDLFFDAPPFKDQTELENHVKSLEKDFNLNVIRVLIRHLTQYMHWRNRTHQEHVSRRRFMLQYLLQHFEIIKMYITWIKPYLKHVSSLSMKERSTKSADIISSFEGSMLDIELLARKRIGVYESEDGKIKKGMSGCCLATFNYRTRPELKVVQEGYQRGPVHIGRFELNLRVYAWDDEQVEKYKRLKDKETIFLMGEVSSSVEAAMTSLGKELDVYLEEARGDRDNKDEKKKQEPQKTIMQKLFGDFYSVKKKGDDIKPPKLPKDLQKKMKGAKGESIGYTKAMVWLTYKNFKKSHGMIQW